MVVHVGHRGSCGSRGYGCVSCDRGSCGHVVVIAVDVIVVHVGHRGC